MAATPEPSRRSIGLRLRALVGRLPGPVGARAMAVAAASLAVAGAATFAPWVQSDFPALAPDEIDDAGLARALDVPTGPVRWAVVLGLVATAVLARWRPGRPWRWLPAVAVGAWCAALTLVGTSGVAVAGGGASVGRAPVVWLAALAAIAAGVAGVADAIGQGAWRRVVRRSVGGAAIVVALLAGVLLAPSKGSSGPAQVGRFEVVVGGAGADGFRWGASARDADLEAIEGRVPTARFGLDLAGGGSAWVLVPSPSSADWVIGEVVDGRVLPRTRLVLTDDQVPDLIGVLDGSALVLVADFDTSAVVRVDLDERPAHLERLDASMTAAGDRRVVLGADEEQGREIRSAVAQVDGAVLVTVAEEVDDTYRVRVHRIAPEDVRGERPWRLDEGVPLDAGGAITAAGTDGAVFRIAGEDGPAQVVDPQGEPVLGGAEDPDCSPSQAALDIDITGPGGLAIDRSGNRWLLRSPVRPGDRSDLIVQTPDGTVKEVLGPLGAATSILAAVDGSIWVLDEVGPAQVQRVLRLEDAADTAADLAAAPERAADCVPPYEIEVPTAREPVTRVASLPLGATPIAADGTAIVQELIDDPDRPGSYRLVEVSPDGTRRLVAERRGGSRELLLADGRGGAWWSDVAGSLEAGDVRPGLGHVDGEGVVTYVELPGPFAPIEATVDPRDGSLLYGQGVDGARFRVRPGGGPERTTPPRVVDDELEAADFDDGATLHGGRGRRFAVEDGRLVVLRVDGTVQIWLGGRNGDLTLPLAIQKTAVDRYATSGAFIGPDGLPLLLDDGYLVRVDDFATVTPLAGPDDGLPPDAEDPVVLDGVVLVRSGDDLYRVGQGP